MRCNGGRCVAQPVNQPCSVGADCAMGLTCRNHFCRALPMGYTFTVGHAPWVDACASPGAGTVLVGALTGACTPPVSIPFPFTFVGVPYTRVNLFGQGYVTFGHDDCASIADSNTVYLGILSGPWGIPSSGAVCYATIGTAPNRQFVIETAGAIDPPSHATFEAILNESDNSIDLVYRDVSVETGIAESVGIYDVTDSPRLINLYQNNTGGWGPTVVPTTPVATGMSLHAAPGPHS